MADYSGPSFGVAVHPGSIIEGRADHTLGSRSAGTSNSAYRAPIFGNRLAQGDANFSYGVKSATSAVFAPVRGGCAPAALTDHLRRAVELM